MLKFFAGTFAIAGLIAASGPLIIHLLNRRRFRRVEWAAMDFLRKAMQRSRRAVELRDLIAAREDDFARGFTKHLIEYALGRPYGFTDEELAEQIVATAREQQYSVRAFLHAIVQTAAFQTK